MNFDVFTTAAVVAELREKLLGGRVQDALELGEESLGFEIYSHHTRHYLLMSAHPTQARLHIVADRMRRGVENHSPLGLMLRRYVENSKLTAIEQPPWERIIILHFEGGEGAFTIIVEPMERRSNILLVRDGRIMDCMRRVGADENRVRVSLPGHLYQPPPPQLNKHTLTNLSPDLIAAALQTDPTKDAWRTLTANLLGMSPMLAKEAVYRTAGKINIKANTISAHDLYVELKGLITPLLRGEFTAGITINDGLITSFAPYPISFLAGWQPRASISEALADFYGAPVGEEAYEAAKKPVREALHDAIIRLEKRIESLQRSHHDETEREHLRQCGELILAYQFQIVAGQTTFSAQYDFDQPPLTIPLDPTLNALDNAKNYFEKYEKAKRASSEIPALIKAAKLELGYLRQLDTDLTIAANYPEIGEVQDTLQARGYWRGTTTTRPHSGKSAPIKVTTSDGIVIWVGRNARQNEDVTFVKGRPEDLWLHVRGVPGSHVIIKANGRSVPHSVLERAASLAAYYSASRNEGHVLVDVTERRYVRKIKGGQVGMVTYRNESPINVAPKSEK